MNIADLEERWKRFAETDRGRRMLKVAKFVFTAGIVAYLAYELTRIGWGNIWGALPTNPLFYLLFLLIYFSLPLTEIFIYRLTWTYPLGRSIPAFIKKRIYNKDVLGYSGEVYFFGWARTNVNLSSRRLLETIRDNNIISSVASTLIAAVLLVVFLYEGEISITRWLGREHVYYLVGGGAALLLLIPVGVRFRKYVFSMPAKIALTIFGIQCVRLLVGQVLQIAQWEVAMPEVSLRVWFTYAAASLIVSRVPFVPNQDLIFLGAGVGLANVMKISSAGVAGMLVMVTALGKIMNLVLFALMSFFDKTTMEDAPEDTDVATSSDAEKVRDTAPVG